MHGLVGPSKPLLPASELTLIYFASHLAKTVSYDTVKLYLVAVQDLHRELNFPLHINKMHRLQKVLTGIKRLAPSTKRDRFPITTQILSAIYNIHDNQQVSNDERFSETSREINKCIVVPKNFHRLPFIEKIAR